MSRITQVFYGNDCLPYKDSERTVHYPITGSSFAGSSNVNELHFYTRDIGGVNNLSWVAIVKLPNGKILYQLLTDIHYDSEINEYYVSFNLSQFYTQLKGDIYISLNGCLGQVEIETDDETDISTIQGEIDSRTVVVTGAVKFTINYAPQRPIGYSFDLDQYQTIIQALANKTNIISTFQIVADISTETLTNYEDGQVFYDIATKRFYKKSDGSYVDYNFVVSNQASVSIIVNPTTNINGRVFVHFTSVPTTIGGASAFQIKYDGENTTEEQAREYMAYMTGSSFLPKYNYDRPANTYFLTPDGQILKPQYDSENGLLLFILPQLAMKSYVDENFVPYTGATKDVDLGGHDITAKHFYKQSSLPNNELATKGELESAIETIKRNSYINVDLIRYPTLQSFLASEGEDGNIYLYPINTSESPTFESGYYQYIWENNQWQDLGTTQIDLSNYYTKPQTNNLLNGKVDKTSSAMKLYGTNGSGNQDTINYGSGTNNNYIVQRDSAGQVFVPETPTRNLHAASKSYVDTQVSPKLDKTSATEKVYGTDELGNQTTYAVDSDLVGDGPVVRRNNSTGTIVTGNPTAVNHAATKKYVDDNINSAISRTYRPMGSKTVAQLNAMTSSELQSGDVYNLLDSGTLTQGNLQVFVGDNVAWIVENGVGRWDKLGTEIDWNAYDEKFIAAGFFEVEDYDEDTGIISLDYATELYDMTYNTDTGVLTIQTI